MYIFSKKSHLIGTTLVKCTEMNDFINMLITSELNSTKFSANYLFMCQYD